MIKNFKFIKILFAITFFTKTLMGLEGNAPVEIQDQFGNMNYKIILFDLKPLIIKKLDRIKIEENLINQDNCILKIYSYFSFDKKFQKEVLFNKGKIIDVTDFISPIKYIPNPEQDLTNLYTYNEKNQEVDFYENGGEYVDEEKCKKIQEDIYTIPRIKDEIEKYNNKRANLFDMLSLRIDDYISSYGIAEDVSVEGSNEKQMQISLLGVIHSEETNFYQLGFLQYTFVEQDGRFYCYHRYFKPANFSNLTRLSNSLTKYIMLLALKSFLIKYENTLENLKLNVKNLEQITQKAIII